MLMISLNVIQFGQNIVLKVMELQISCYNGNKGNEGNESSSIYDYTSFDCNAMKTCDNFSGSSDGVIITIMNMTQ